MSSASRPEVTLATASAAPASASLAAADDALHRVAASHLLIAEVMTWPKEAADRLQGNRSDDSYGPGRSCVRVSGGEAFDVLEIVVQAGCDQFGDLFLCLDGEVGLLLGDGEGFFSRGFGVGDEFLGLFLGGFGLEGGLRGLHGLFGVGVLDLANGLGGVGHDGLDFDGGVEIGFGHGDIGVDVRLGEGGLREFGHGELGHVELGHFEGGGGFVGHV